jgi:hypothetical protein
MKNFVSNEFGSLKEQQKQLEIVRKTDTMYLTVNGIHKFSIFVRVNIFWRN